ncbi:MAG: sensor histidine kinase [Spirochaetia bacterium]
MGILGPSISARIIEREVTNHTVQLIRQVTRNAELYIRKMESLASILVADADVQAFYRIDDQGAPFSPDSQRRALRLLGNITRVNSEIAGILLVNDADGYLSNEIQPITRDPLLEEDWYRRAIRYAPDVQLLPRPVGRNLRNTPGYSADDVVSIVKAVIDPRTGRARGVVLIDMKLQVVQDIFVDMKVGQGGFLFIEDAEGGTVYAPVNPVVYRVRGDWLAGPQTSVIRRIQGADYQILAQSSDYTGWKTIGVFPLNEIMGQVSLIRYYSFIIAGVTLFIAAVASIFFTGSIARPVIALRVLMKEAEEGNLAVRFQGREEDEIGHLGKSFNTMIEEIQKLIDLVYREQQSKREAELKTLQEQIKPHFLYNTLDTIHWMAQARGANDIVQIVSALTSLFRIALSKGKEMISLSDELEHVRSYLIIQKLRYEDKFDYSLCVQDDVLPYMVLKLTLQPLVENAIYHGIKERRGHGIIRVDALRRDQTLVLRVCDDGVGMSDEKLTEVRTLLSKAPAESSQKTGYGISNVNERIQLSFGKSFGLRFESSPGGGTTVEIMHPLIRGKE